MQEYLNKQKQDAIQSNRSYPTMSERDKENLRKKIDNILSSGAQSHLKGSRIICLYKVDDTLYNTVFLIDTDFKNVYGAIDGR